MKSLAITTILTVGILSAVAYAGEIPEGKYVFSSPALFGSAEGEAREKLCELEATKDGYPAHLSEQSSESWFTNHFFHQEWPNRFR